MHSDDERCVHARKIQAIERAFVGGDLEALERRGRPVSRAQRRDADRNRLVSRLRHPPSPLSFIRTLLELGADPNAPVDDGFPPLIAALSCSQQAPGATPRTDFEDVLRLLLSFGADPNQRGHNDYTPLHMAVAVRQPQAIADPAWRRRRSRSTHAHRRLRYADRDGGICRLGRTGVGHGAKGQPVRQRLRSGSDPARGSARDRAAGAQAAAYRIRLRMWLKQGEPCDGRPLGTGGRGKARRPGRDAGHRSPRQPRPTRQWTLLWHRRDARGRDPPAGDRAHLGYADRGVPGVIPPNAALTAEITILGLAPSARELARQHVSRSGRWWNSWGATGGRAVNAPPCPLVQGSMPTFFGELRYGIRLLRRAPGFAATAVLTLALGIGATTALFSVVNAVLIEPLPFPKSQDLLQVWRSELPSLTYGSASYARYLDWARDQRTFTELGAWAPRGVTIAGREGPERVAGATASAPFFPRDGGVTGAGALVHGGGGPAWRRARCRDQ